MDHKILVTVFQCIPVSGYWNKDIPSKCIDDNHFFIGSSIANILTDLALLLLPTRYIWRLHRTTSQKLALAITFMLGGLYATTFPVPNGVATLLTDSQCYHHLDYSHYHSLQT